MVAEIGYDSRVVHIDEFAVLDVRTSGKAVVGIEESGIDTCNNILAFSRFACTEL